MSTTQRILLVSICDLSTVAWSVGPETPHTSRARIKRLSFKVLSGRPKIGGTSWHSSHVKMSGTLSPAQIMTSHQRLRLILQVISLALLLVWPARSSTPNGIAFSKRLRVMTYNIHVGVGID